MGPKAIGIGVASPSTISSTLPWLHQRTKLGRG